MENSMVINGGKVQIMKFKKGRMLARHYYFTCGQNRLEIAMFQMPGNNAANKHNSIYPAHPGQSYSCHLSNS
jgi:hypothetical protein